MNMAVFKPGVRSALQYPKIETLYDRDSAFKVIVGQYRRPEFLLPHRWLVTEKIDGMNVRIVLKADDLASRGVFFYGRTDAAQLHPDLQAYLSAMFPLDKVEAAFDPNSAAVLFGEAYGPKIQSGGIYRADISFRLFDVVVFGEKGRPWWLNWSSVTDIATKLGIQTVPVLVVAAGIDVAADFYLRGPSYTALMESGKTVLQEGVVARTDPLLFDRRGARVMWKLKRSDFEVAS